jgi:hypothetical protein
MRRPVIRRQVTWRTAKRATVMCTTGRCPAGGRYPPGTFRASTDARQRQQKAGDSADPDRGAELVQEGDREQRTAMIQPCRRMCRERCGRQFDQHEAKQHGHRCAWPPPQQHHQDQHGRRGLHQAGDCEVGAQNVAHRQVHRASQHSDLQRHRGCLEHDQCQRAPDSDAHGTVQDWSGGRPQPWAQRAAEQREEQHGAKRHRLRGSRQSMQHDREVAEQINEQRH